MKELQFATDHKSEVAGEFKLNGEVYTVQTVPSGRLTHLIAAVNNAEADGTKLISRVFNFMERALLPEDVSRLEVVIVELTTEQIMEIFQTVVELVAGGKAGGSSTGSAASPKRSGRASTGSARSAASTR